MLNTQFEMDVTEIPEPMEKVIIESEMPTTPEQLDRLDKAANKSINRTALYNEGYAAGFNAAADDFVNGKVDLIIFDKTREEREINDYYAIGFEMGYFRKLAEIAVL